MMSLQKARNIIGYDVDCYPSGDQWVAEANLADLGKSVRSIQKSKEEALSDLVELAYRTLCFEVFRKQKWRCAECNRLLPLQGDHVVPRSKGRVDRGNIRGLCAEDHARKHRRKADRGE